MMILTMMTTRKAATARPSAEQWQLFLNFQKAEKEKSRPKENPSANDERLKRSFANPRRMNSTHMAEPQGRTCQRSMWHFTLLSTVTGKTSTTLSEEALVQILDKSS